MSGWIWWLGWGALAYGLGWAHGAHKGYRQAMGELGDLQPDRLRALLRETYNAYRELSDARWPLSAKYTEGLYADDPAYVEECARYLRLREAVNKVAPQ